MKRKFSLVLLLLAAWLGGAQPAYAATDSQDSNITIVKKTRVAYNKGNKVNTWTTYRAGKKLVGQVKSGYKFTATGQAQYKGRTWYRIKDNKWILGTNTVTTKKYASIKAAAAKKTKQNKVVKLANAQVGKAYVWGATGPSSFDCSGLVQWVYRTAIGQTVSRTTYTQVKEGVAVPVSTASLQPGDLLFWGDVAAPYHVAIYVGNGQYVSAADEQQGVILATISSYFWPTTARRIL